MQYPGRIRRLIIIEVDRSQCDKEAELIEIKGVSDAQNTTSRPKLVGNRANDTAWEKSTDSRYKKKITTSY